MAGAKFFLTRRSYRNLLEIERYSIAKWGEDRTARYMARIYQGFEQIAANPEVGRLRARRSMPFLMAPVGAHYAIYKIADRGVIIATVLHNRRDIEAITGSLASRLHKEIRQVTDGD